MNLRRNRLSTHNSNSLPAIQNLKALCQSLAVLDAILCPQWEWRTYSFRSAWSECVNMALMRDSSGDHYFVLFTPAGAVIKGFAHESRMSPYRSHPPEVWKGLLDEVPASIAVHLSDPAIMLEDTTFCIWRSYHDAQWHHGAISFPAGLDPDGSAELLGMLDGLPSTYRSWAAENYDRRVELRAVQSIYNHEAVTEDLVKRLNPDMTLQALQPDLTEIGYVNV